MAMTQETSVPGASYLYLQNAENIELDRSPCGDRKWFHYNSSIKSRTVARARAISLLKPTPWRLSFSSDFEVSPPFQLSGRVRPQKGVLLAGLQPRHHFILPAAG
jgi:hypothetical protein